MQKIRTVLGDIDTAAMGLTLPHEHIMVGFDPKGVTSDQYNHDDVSKKMLPHLKALYDTGVRTLVECTPVTLGRDMILWQRLSRESGLHIVAPTGAYKEPHVPPYALTETPQQMSARWIDEARNGVDGVLPGFIKIAMEGEKRTQIERNIFDAALLTSNECGLAIVCHCTKPQGMLEAMERMAEVKFDTERFIWAHADTVCLSEPGGEDAVKLAKDRGLWIEFDMIGMQPYDKHISLLNRFWSPDARLLISQDSGWYMVGDPDYEVRTYSTIITDFVPLLPNEMSTPLTLHNPAKAFRIR